MGRAEHLSASIIAYSTSVGHHCDPMISNPCRREALCFNEGMLDGTLDQWSQWMRGEGL
jgi:hypothetical protein